MSNISSMRPIKDVVFRDIDIRFEPHPVTRQLLIKKNAEAVKQAVKNLVLTNRYEKLFRPDIYGGVTELLFENVDEATLILLRQQIEDVITYHEPRAKLEKVNVREDFDRNGFIVDVIFSIRNVKEPFTVSAFFERIR